MLVRPWGMLLLPAVLWATLAWAVTIGFLVAITTCAPFLPFPRKWFAHVTLFGLATLRLRLEVPLTTLQRFNPRL